MAAVPATSSSSLASSSSVNVDVVRCYVGSISCESGDDDDDEGDDDDDDDDGDVVERPTTATSLPSWCPSRERQTELRVLDRGVECRC